MENNELLKVILKGAYDKKAAEMEIIKVAGLTSISDYFVICTGTSTTHVKAISDAIEKEAKEKCGIIPTHIEGYDAGTWILLDYGNVVIHIFLNETRRFYSLERLWADAPKPALSEFIEIEQEQK